jgi:hypothetical protein
MAKVVMIDPRRSGAVRKAVAASLSRRPWRVCFGARGRRPERELERVEAEEDEELTLLHIDVKGRQGHTPPWWGAWPCMAATKPLSQARGGRRRAQLWNPI